MKKNSILLLFVFLVTIVHAQVVYRGTILDQNSRPLYGVTISLSSLGAQTMTNKNGEFYMSAAYGKDTLFFSLVGYETVVLPTNKDVAASSLSITMSQKQGTIEEVIVNTGYYSIPKERATGSFTHIDNKLLNRSMGGNLLERLEGVTNSVLFDRRNIADEDLDGRPEIRVRGLSTIDSDSSPLIVLDNFPYDGDISAINPNDIESVTVLRDAAAASIWGARAGNGVIVINTKQGTYNRHPSINFTSNQTFGAKPDLFYDQTFLPSETVMSIQKELFERGTYQERNQTRIPAYVELLIKRRDGKLSEEGFLEQEAFYASTDLRRDWKQHLYQVLHRQQYVLGLSGGADRYRYSFNTGYDKTDYNILGNGQRRFNINMQNAYKARENLEINGSIWYTANQVNGNGIGFSVSNNTDIYMPLVDPMGNASHLTRSYRLAYQESAPDFGLLDWLYKPIDEVGYTDNKNREIEWRINTGVNYSVLNALSLQGSYQYTQGSGKAETYYAPGSYYVRNLVNRFTQSDGTLVIPHGGIMEYEAPRNHSTHSGRLQLNYNNAIAADHELTGLVGAEIRTTLFQSTPGLTLYNFNPDTWSADYFVNYADRYPTRPTGNSNIPTNTLSPGRTNGRNLSYYGNGSYTYKRKYILSASARWDASNLLGVKTNQRGTALWSLGGSWNISDEKFFRWEPLNYFRLRITYGSAGNIDKSQSQYPTIAYTTDMVTGFRVSNLNHPGNPSLRWEQVNTLNVGIDMRWFGDRIILGAEWYRKISRDLLGNHMVDPSTGVSSNFKMNYADMLTEGVDLQLATTNIQNGFRWTSDLLLNVTSNKLTNFNGPLVTTIATYIFDPPPVDGKSLDLIYAYSWHGLNGQTGYPVVMVDGQESSDYTAFANNITYDDLVQAGSTVPTLFGSVRNSFTWKGIQLSALVMFKSGFVFRRSSMGSGQEYGSIPYYHMDYFKRWQQSGDERETDVPAWANTTSNATGWAIYRDSEALITDGSSIRLHDIQASYLVPLGNNGTESKNIRVFCGVKNVGILWRANDHNIDPDYPNARYPAPRVFNFGATLNL